MLNYVFSFCCSSRKLDEDSHPKSERPSLHSPPPEENFMNYFDEQRDHYADNFQTASPPIRIDDYVDSSAQNTDQFLILDDQPEGKIDTQSIHDMGSTKKIKKRRQDQQKRYIKLWNDHEDAILLKYYVICEGNWKNIAQMIPGRNISQCSQRWRRMNPNTVAKKFFIKNKSKNKWSMVEDQLVIDLVVSHGKNWGFIAKYLPKRTGKQIRERYLNKLDPTLNTGDWTQEEDDTILQIFRSHGTRWSKIAGELRGRSENMVKNRFYTYIKRVLLGETNPYQIVHNTDHQYEQPLMMMQNGESQQPLMDKFDYDQCSIWNIN